MDNISRTFSSFILSSPRGRGRQAGDGVSNRTPSAQNRSDAEIAMPGRRLVSRRISSKVDTIELVFRGEALKNAIRRGDIKLTETILADFFGDRPVKWCSFLYLKAYHGFCEDIMIASDDYFDLAVGSSPILLAAFYGHFEVVCNILNKSKDLNSDLSSAMAGLNLSMKHEFNPDINDIKTAFELLLKGSKEVPVDFLKVITETFGFNPNEKPISLQNIALRKVSSLVDSQGIEQLPLPKKMKSLLLNRGDKEFYN